MFALAALGDREYQERVWLRRVYPHPGYYADLTGAIAVLYDVRVLPSPEVTLSSVTLGGDEIGRLRQLAALLDPLIERLGDAPDDTYMRDPAWADVVAAATAALLAVVNAGGFVGPGERSPDAEEPAGR